VQADAEGLTLAQAAARLGVSTDTVRRRIKRGELSAKQVESKFGPAWMVLLSPASPPGNGVHGAAPAPAPGVVELVALVRDLQVELLRRTEAATAWQLRAEQLAGRVEQLQAALEAPRAEQASPQPPAAVEVGVEATARPWWRFW
jgi:excisionase family DNA binding protein